jgi:hypothetical protein
MPNPWDVLPRESAGDPTPEPLFLAVGMALSAWEIMDGWQATLFGELVSSRRGAAETAYGTVVSSSGRADMVLAAADRLLTDSAGDHLAELTTLVNDIGKLSGRRNEIAHGFVCNFETTSSNGCYLVPPIYNSKKHLTSSAMRERMAKFTSSIEIAQDFPFARYKYAYTASQIRTYTGHFRDYQKKMLDMVFKTREICDALPELRGTRL